MENPYCSCKLTRELCGQDWFGTQWNVDPAGRPVPPAPSRLNNSTLPPRAPAAGRREELWRASKPSCVDRTALTPPPFAPVQAPSLGRRYPSLAEATVGEENAFGETFNKTH